MAITFANLTSGADTAAATSYATASITPSANQLILAFVGVAVNTAPAPEPVLSGNGLTWVRVEGTFAARGVAVYRAMGASPSAGAVTIASPAGETYSLGTWSIVQFAGVDTSGTNGSGAIAQALPGNGSGTGGAVTLSSAVTAGNATAAVYQVNLDEPMTPRVNWTEIAELRDPTPVTTMASQYRLAGEQASSADWTSSGAWRGIVVEIRASAAAVNHTNTQTDATGLTDTTTRLSGVGHSRAQTDAVGLADTVTPLLKVSHARAQTDAAGLADTVTPLLKVSHVKADTETVGLRDSITILSGVEKTREHSDVAVLSDIATPILRGPAYTDDRIKVKVWKKLDAGGWGVIAEIRTWSEVDFAPRYLQPGDWSLRMPYNTQSAKIDKKHLFTFDYRGERTTGIIEHIGPLSDETGKPYLEVSGVDAFAILGDTLCWPVPTAALSLQSEARYRATGPAETVLRDVIRANAVTRKGDDLIVAGTGARGGTVTLNERFTNLMQVVSTACEIGGIGCKVGLKDTTSSTRAVMTVEFWVPEDKSVRARLSHKVGTLRTWRQNDDAPTGTRVVVAGQGVGTARVFRSRVATEAETTWGRKIERFVDARDVELGTATEAVLLDQRGDEALLETKDQSSFELEAVEAEGARYGLHFRLGDLVTVELLTGVSKVDRLRSVHITSNLEGMSVHLIPGNPDSTDPMFAQSAITRTIRRQVKALEREEKV